MLRLSGVARNLLRGTKQGAWGRKPLSGVQGQKLETYTDDGVDMHQCPPPLGYTTIEVIRLAFG